ncbi:Transmembrane protein [Schistosoma japonicum]|nr:Transmembrane protein [Schistosoma japonicum]
MLTACGAFMGLTYCLTVLVLNKLTLNYAYPVGNIFVIMKKQFFARLLTTIGKTLYFLPLYAICLSLFLYPHQRESFIWRVFDYQLILLILVTTFHLQFSWSCVVDVLKSQFLKPIDIPLSSVLDPSRSVLGILSDSSNPLEQHLALERLADLVATNQNVRLSIFSLSHLGGRPVLWKQISNLCFQLIDRFLLNVHKSNNRGVNLLSIPFGARKIDFKFRQFLPSSFDEHLRRRNNVRVKPLPGINGSTYNMQPSESIAHNLTDSSRAFLSKIFTLLSQTQLFSILSSEIAYAPTAHLFATALDIECADCLDTDKPSVQTSGQAIIWATEILACLTLASYNEDHFGSVQRSLGRILLLFADAVEAVEKHLKLVGLLTSQYKQVINCSIADSLCTTTLSTGHLQTPLRNSKQLSGSVFPSDDLCKFTYYCFASDPTLPWRVYATFSWALTNCLNQYSDCFATITLDNKSKEKLQLLKASRCIMREN